MENVNIADYKDVYVFIEQRDGVVQNVSLELLGKARELADAVGEKVVAVLKGENIMELAPRMIAGGADLVVCVDEQELATYTTEPYAQAVAEIVRRRKPSIVLIGATTVGRDLGPRLSARLETGLTADCTGLEMAEEGHLLMTRPAFGGNLMATIVCKKHRPQMSTVRPGVMRANAADPDRKGEIVRERVSFDKSKFRVRVVETGKEETANIDIADA